MFTAPCQPLLRVCGQKHSGILLLHLEQKLVLHDPLDRFDEQVVELQPVAQLLPELLTAKRGNISQQNSHSPQHII